MSEKWKRHWIRLSGVLIGVGAVIVAITPSGGWGEILGAACQFMGACGIAEFVEVRR